MRTYRLNPHRVIAYVFLICFTLMGYLFSVAPALAATSPNKSTVKVKIVLRGKYSQGKKDKNKIGKNNKKENALPLHSKHKKSPKGNGKNNAVILNSYRENSKKNGTTYPNDRKKNNHSDVLIPSSKRRNNKKVTAAPLPLGGKNDDENDRDTLGNASVNAQTIKVREPNASTKGGNYFLTGTSKALANDVFSDLLPNSRRQGYNSKSGNVLAPDYDKKSDVNNGVPLPSNTTQSGAMREDGKKIDAPSPLSDKKESNGSSDVVFPNGQRKSNREDDVTVPDSIEKNAASSGGFAPIVLAVHVNQQDTNAPVILLTTIAGDVLANVDDIKNWKIYYAPQSAPISYRGKSYYSLRDFPGLKYTVDQQRALLLVDIPGELFVSQNLSGIPAGFLVPTTPSNGFFFNYNVLAQTTKDASQISGLLDANIFNKYGSGMTEFLAQRNISSSIGAQGQANKFTRLNTVWRKDDPLKMHVLRLGDSFSVPGMWGKSVSFGGIQWGSNFAIQPNFLPYPLPSTTGVATLPTAVDLYVNNMLVKKNDIAAGPFAINAIPVTTGEGMVNVVTTDLLGRQQITSIPYYLSDRLLKPGLHDYSYEAGFIRNNFGTDSNNYGQLMLAGTNRFGITNNFTSEWHTELLSSQQALGMGGSYLVSRLGVLSAAVAASRSDRLGVGQLAALGFQRQAMKGISYSVNVTATTVKFAQTGLQADQLSPAMTAQAFVGFPVTSRSSMGISYIRQKNRSTDDAGIISASYNYSFKNSWSLSATAMTNVAGQRGTSCFTSLNIPLGDRTSASINAIGQKDSSQINAEVRRNLPAGSGWGYDVLVGQGQQKNYQASVSAQNSVGTYTASAARQGNDTGYRLQADGGVILLGGEISPTRTITNSFAVVQVPQQPNVRVYSSNQIVAHTNRRGNAVVPNLVSYTKNSIRIEPNDLPLTAKLDGSEMVAVPYERSGVILKFPIKSSYNAVIKLISPSGNPVPAGAIVTPVGKDGQIYPVADDGEVFLTELALGKNYLQVAWDGQLYKFVVDYQNSSNPIANLGTIFCGENKHVV